MSQFSLDKSASIRASAGTVSGLTATAIVIADMVGVGVFTSLGFQVADIKSGFALLMLWVVGGVVAICGAFCYAELATMLPRSSGEYNFLRQIYHPAFGFVAGWLSATVGFAAPIALAAMAFGSYSKAIAPQAPPLILGIGVIWLTALVHLRGVRFGGAFHNVWTALKLILIVAFIVAGFAFGDLQPISFAPSAADLSAVAGAPFAISLVFVMYSYSGWNAATYIVGELREPARNLPRALLAGTAIVIVLYVGLNAVFLATTPIQELAGHLDVASIAGQHVFGSFGGRIVGALICLGLISSISAMTWIGPRVTMTMGEDMPAAAFVRAPVQARRAGRRHCLSAPGGEPAAVDPELRSGAGFHPVQPRFLLVFYGPGRHQNAHHPPKSIAAVSHLVLPRDAARFPHGDVVRDVLSRRQPAAAVSRRPRHHVGRPRDLLYVSPAIQDPRSGRFPNSAPEGRCPRPRLS